MLDEQAVAMRPRNWRPGSPVTSTFASDRGGKIAIPPADLRATAATSGD